MKFRLFLAITLSISALGLFIGCMDVPPTGSLNDYCGVQHPGPGEINSTTASVLPNGSVALRQDVAFTPPPANYAFQLANVLYNDTFNNLEFYFSVKKASNGTLTPSLICMAGGGMKVGMQSFDSIPAPFVSGLTYDGKALKIQEQSLSFTFGRPPPDQMSKSYLRNMTINPITSSANLSSTFDVFSGFTQIQQTFNQIAPANQNAYLLWVTATRPALGQKSSGTGLNIKELVYLNAVAN